MLVSAYACTCRYEKEACDVIYNITFQFLCDKAFSRNRQGKYE